MNGRLYLQLKLSHFVPTFLVIIPYTTQNIQIFPSVLGGVCKAFLCLFFFFFLNLLYQSQQAHCENRCISHLQVCLSFQKCLLFTNNVLRLSAGQRLHCSIRMCRQRLSPKINDCCVSAFANQKSHSCFNCCCDRAHLL